MHAYPFRHILGRRRFLGNEFSGLAGVGLASLLGRDANGAVPGWRPEAGITHFPPKAKRVLQIFCPGAASHIDLWVYKPELFKRSGQPLPGEENFSSFQGKNGNLMRPPWDFAPA